MKKHELNTLVAYLNLHSGESACSCGKGFSVRYYVVAGSTGKRLYFHRCGDDSRGPRFSTENEVSPRLPIGRLYQWVEAYANGILYERKRAGEEEVV